MFRYLIALILLAGVMLPAQTTETPDYKMTVDVELVQLPVSVFDRRGAPVRGLQREHFTVYEDNVMQQISLFTQEDMPLTVGLVIDASGSMLTKLERLKTAALTFLRASNPQDQMSLVIFGEDVLIEPAFTGNTDVLDRALVALPSNRGTALYDAVARAAEQLQDGAHEKKVLVIVSDGEDNKSEKTLQAVREILGKSKVMVYTIGLMDSGFSHPGKIVMKQLAEGTGGTSFFPGGVEQVAEICRKIARDLRNQYTLGYRPSNSSWDGSWRKIAIDIRPPKDSPRLQFRTKQGYYAVPPIAASTARPTGTSLQN